MTDAAIFASRLALIFQYPRQVDHRNRDFQQEGKYQQQPLGNLDRAGVSGHDFFQGSGRHKGEDIGKDHVEHHHNPEGGEFSIHFFHPSHLIEAIHFNSSFNR